MLQRVNPATGFFNLRSHQLTGFFDLRQLAAYPEDTSDKDRTASSKSAGSESKTIRVNIV